jgi:hypothetical protein
MTSEELKKEAEEISLRSKLTWELIESALNKYNCTLNFNVEVCGNQIPIEEIIKCRIFVVVTPL